MSVKIFAVEKGSAADKKRIKQGEKLISINGNEIFDVLDYRFYQLSERLTLKIEKANGRVRTVKIKKDEYEE